MNANRQQVLRSARRIVVKVGSSSITGKNVHQVDTLIDTLAASHSHGNEVILVSSGAISTGVPLMNLVERPTDLATQQAAAAVGQNALMVRYQQSLARYEMIGAQILLTASDMEGTTTRQNARRAMERLLELRILPIVNENDTVATHEIRFGDNDRLAALVAVLIEADLLILLSDIDGLYTKPPTHPEAERIPLIGYNENLQGLEFGDIGSAGVGTGGAVTKVAAAKYAAQHGVPVLFTSTANIPNLGALTGGTPLTDHELDQLGTWFVANPELRPITENVQLGL